MSQSIVFQKRKPVWVLLGFALIGLGWVLSGCSKQGQGCKTAADCGPGFFCNSTSKCIPGCQLSVECPVGQGCRGNKCLAVTGDKDQDGFYEPIDCDDSKPLINPGADEICNNKIDDNCDGRTDEEGCVDVQCSPGESQECYSGKNGTIAPGRPCRKGRQTCSSDGKWSECQGQVLPTQERCDGADNDCDGKVDEGDKSDNLTRECYNAASSTRDIGPCKGGTQTCKGGRWSKCEGEVTPKEEQCNETDDNCDGKVDNPSQEGEGCKTGKAGECAIGRLACDKTQKKLVCKQLLESKSEVCDGKDNDCDGQVDNGCPYIPEKVGTVAGFPQAVAVSKSWAAVSLRDTKKVAIYDNSKANAPKIGEVPVPEAPYGIQIVSDNAYVATDKTIQKIDMVRKQASELVKTQEAASQNGQMVELGGRLYTRLWKKGAQSKDSILKFCRTDPNVPKIECKAATGGFDSAGYGVALWRSTGTGLMLSDQGLHFIDILNLNENPKQRLAVTADVLDIAMDTGKPIATVVDKAFKKIFLVNVLTRGTPTQFDTTDKNGDSTEPNRVISADGYAYVSLKSNQIAVIDLSQNRIIKYISVGVAPLGMGISPRDGANGRVVWVACPGDNSIWRFRVP